MSCTYADEAHWSYSGDDGPEHWGSLDESWQLCSSGKNQSPIDLGGAINATLPELAFKVFAEFLERTSQQGFGFGGFG